MSIDERNPADAEYSIDLALTSASMMLEGGASAASVVMAMQDVAAAAGLDDVTADVNHSILTISEHGTAHVGATAISSRTYDFGRLRDTTRIVDDLCAGRIGVATANDRVHQVADADLVVTISALVVNIVLAWAHGTLTRRGWPLFFAQFIAGVVAVAVAATVATVHAHTDTSLTVTSVIVLLLPGVAFIGGVKDAISGWYLTAVARLTEAVTSIAGLIIGIQFALAAAAYFGVELDVKPPAFINLAPIVSTLMAAGGIALFFGIVSGNSPKTLVASMVLSSAGLTIYTRALDSHLGSHWATTVAAVTIAALASVIGKLDRTPTLAITTPAMLPLLPGITLYQGMFDGGDGVQSAVILALALAAGLTAGEYLTTTALRSMRITRPRRSRPTDAADS
jgi:uncharacterized membrane protein YjjP (DUF1212 family)